mmetsp:Transcript_21498/g.30121  ORF Transcript_21498/g.30121 Transcript_21498/m.30121 type:complete len:258 (-) Transcript_21498:177-950(-)
MSSPSTLHLLREPSEEDNHEDLTCAICYFHYAEPVKTPCGHIFCKNCLVKTFGFIRPPRCPMCRADCTSVRVFELKVDTEIEKAVRRVDSEYKERASKATAERKVWMQSKLLLPILQHSSSSGAMFEVSGAGSDIVNGIYIVGNISSYLGPQLYIKPGTQVYIFRWSRREWIIGSLEHGFQAITQRYYKVDCSFVPEDSPPEGGWTVAPSGLGISPAPTIRVLRQGDRISPRLLQPLVQSANVPDASPSRCSPCSIM